MQVRFSISLEALEKALKAPPEELGAFLRNIVYRVAPILLQAYVASLITKEKTQKVRETFSTKFSNFFLKND